MTIGKYVPIPPCSRCKKKDQGRVLMGKEGKPTACIIVERINCKCNFSKGKGVTVVYSNNLKQEMLNTHPKVAEALLLKKE
jgi:hypothetical protein